MLTVLTQVIYAWGGKEKEPKWLRDLVDTPYCIEVSTKNVPKQPMFLKKHLVPVEFSRDV